MKTLTAVTSLSFLVKISYSFKDMSGRRMWEGRPALGFKDTDTVLFLKLGVGHMV